MLVPAVFAGVDRPLADAPVPQRLFDGLLLAIRRRGGAARRGLWPPIRKERVATQSPSSTTTSSATTRCVRPTPSTTAPRFDAVVRLGREDIVVIGRWPRVDRPRPGARSPAVAPADRVGRPEILLAGGRTAIPGPPRRGPASPKALVISDAFASDALVVVRWSPAAGDCRLGDLPSLRLQGAARPARTARAWARAHGSVRPHGVGDDGPDERAVPRSDGGQRAGARVGRGVL